MEELRIVITGSKDFNDYELLKKEVIKQPISIKQEPYVGDDGIYMPYNEYVPEGCETKYKCILTKEMFIEAYNKWIKGE